MIVYNNKNNKRYGSGMLDIDIDNKIRVPLYQQIADEIQKQIESGKLPRYSMLPNERSICADLKINRQTLRKSLQILVEKELIYKEWGNGAFVGKKKTQPISLEPIVQTIGVSVPSHCDASHIAVACDKLSRRLAKENFQTFRMPHFDENNEKQLLQHSRNFLSGVIFYPKLNSRENLHNIRYMISQKIPCVAMSYPVSGVDIDSVVSDDYRGAIAAVDYFRSKGHQRIAFIQSSNALASRSERRTGYEDAIIAAELKQIFSAVTDKPSIKKQYEAGYESIQDFYKRLQRPPTAILAQNDLLAAGALKALSDLNIAVPDEVEVVGFGNDLEAAVMYSNGKSPVSTVAVDHEKIGKIAAELMLRRLRDPNKEIIQHNISTKLTHRKTTKGDNRKKDEK